MSALPSCVRTRPDQSTVVCGAIDARCPHRTAPPLRTPPPMTILIFTTTSLTCRLCRLLTASGARRRWCRALIPAEPNGAPLHSMWSCCRVERGNSTRNVLRRIRDRRKRCSACCVAVTALSQGCGAVPSGILHAQHAAATDLVCCAGRILARQVDHPVPAPPGPASQVQGCAVQEAGVTFPVMLPAPRSVFRLSIGTCGPFRGICSTTQTTADVLN